MRANAWLLRAAAVLAATSLLPGLSLRAQAAAPGVARAIAARWGVAPEQVHLAWIDDGDSLDIGSATSVRPADGVRGERWLVTFQANEKARLVRAGISTIEMRAARDIARGATLAAADIATDTVVRWGAPAESRVPVAEGWVARSTIAEGALLRAPAVAPPAAVRAGDTVQVVWRGAGVVASARGRAAATVAEGEPVPVRLENGRRIEGRALGGGRVLVP